MAESTDNARQDPFVNAEPVCPPPETRSRRDVVRQGMKLAFVAPVLSTFFARDAYAAGYSCYPTGQSCAVSPQEPCCNGACNLGVCP